MCQSLNITRCQDHSIPTAPDSGEELKVPPPVELQWPRVEVLTLLEHQQDTQAFLERCVPPPILEVYPDWKGLLVKSAVLSMSVWIVRVCQDGEELAKETGQPALLLDDVLSQKGRSPEEAREALLPLLIISEGTPEGQPEGQQRKSAAVW